MNLYIAKPSTKSLSSMYFYAHSKGLKTGVYYLRTKPNVSAVKVAIPYNKMKVMKMLIWCVQDQKDVFYVLHNNT